MKYIISLMLGFIVGACLFILALIYNPFVADRGLSPLAVTDAAVIMLGFATVPSESIAYTNNGELGHRPHPAEVPQFWEAPIRKTSAMVSLMRDGRNQPAGIGVKFSSLSEDTRLLYGKAIVDSVWYVYLPERGSLFLRQTENYWPLLREVAFPAWKNSGKTWRGTWFGDLTAGPGALGTAAVSGGSGKLRDLETIGVESLSVRAFSTDTGFIAADGRLIIEIPTPNEAPAEEESGSEVL